MFFFDGTQESEIRVPSTLTLQADVIRMGKLSLFLVEPLSQSESEHEIRGPSMVIFQGSDENSPDFHRFLQNRRVDRSWKLKYVVR